MATSFRHYRHFYSSGSTSGMTLSLPQKRSAALPQPKEKHQPSARKPHPSKRPLHPEGVDTSQPRVATEGSAPWVRRSRGTNPEGVPHVASGCTTPSGLGFPRPRFPGCAPASRPWAVMDNPFGVQRSSGHREFAERAIILSRHPNWNGLQCRVRSHRAVDGRIPCERFPDWSRSVADPATRRVSESVRLSMFCESSALSRISGHSAVAGDSGWHSSLRSALADASGD